MALGDKGGIGASQVGQDQNLHISLSTSKTFSMRAGQGKMRENPGGAVEGEGFWGEGKTKADDKLLHMLTKLGSYSYSTAAAAAPIQKSWNWFKPS